jgi:hypothetical protein
MNAVLKPVPLSAMQPGLVIIGPEHPRRMAFLPNHFTQVAMIRVESLIYAYADRYLDGYHGGVWDFAETPSGAGFMIPPVGPVSACAGDEPIQTGAYDWRPSEVSCFDGGRISREAAGLALTILAVNHLLFRFQDNTRVYDRLVYEYTGLMEYAHQHPEARTLYRILD